MRILTWRKVSWVSLLIFITFLLRSLDFTLGDRSAFLTGTFESDTSIRNKLAAFVYSNTGLAGEFLLSLLTVYVVYCLYIYLNSVRRLNPKFRGIIPQIHLILAIFSPAFLSFVTIAGKDQLASLFLLAAVCFRTKKTTLPSESFFKLNFWFLVAFLILRPALAPIGILMYLTTHPTALINRFLQPLYMYFCRIRPRSMLKLIFFSFACGLTYIFFYLVSPHLQPVIAMFTTKGSTFSPLITQDDGIGYSLLVGLPAIFFGVSIPHFEMSVTKSLVILVSYATTFALPAILWLRTQGANTTISSDSPVNILRFFTILFVAAYAILFSLLNPGALLRFFSCFFLSYIYIVLGNSYRRS